MTELLPRTDRGDDPFRVFLRRDLLAAGYSERAIAARVRSDEWTRVRRGGYLTTTDWTPLDARDRHAVVARAVLRQARTRLVLSHVSAVPEHGGPDHGLDLRDVHATRPDQRAGRVEAGVHQHQGKLLDGDIVTRRGVEVTSATKTVLDLSTIASIETSVCVANDFLHRGLTTETLLADRYALMAMDPHTLRTEVVLRLADERIESVGESLTWMVCWRHAVPTPQPQYVVTDGRGREVARLDFAWPEHKVWLEFDGRMKYGALLREGQSTVDVVLAEKRREELVADLTGWRCIRVTWADLQQPARLADRIRRTLAGERQFS